MCETDQSVEVPMAGSLAGRYYVILEQNSMEQKCIKYARYQIHFITHSDLFDSS